MSNFAGSFAGVNGHHELTLSWNDIVRAAITTGYPNLASATMPAGFNRTWAVLYRASIVLAYLEAPGGSRILRSDDYNRADRSEKGSISYYLGLFAAKLGAEMLLNTPWLWHYDTYYHLAHGVGPISRRPDLIGRTMAGEWIVVEAKGRTNGWTDRLMASAKSQARTIDRIVHPGGAIDPIDANVASVSFFDGEGWSLLMEDPKPKPGPLRLGAPVEDLYRAYYRPLIAYVTSALEGDTATTVVIDDKEFKVVHDADLDIFVGLSAAVLESEGTNLEGIAAGVSAAPDTRDSRQGRVSKEYLDQFDRRWSVGADGVAVRLGTRWE